MTSEDIKQDFESALIKHLLFKSKLRSFLYSGGQSEGPVRDPDQCGLGVWIRERRAGAYAHLKAEMTLLDRLHRQLHAEANQLMDRHRPEAPDAGQAALASLQPLADQITALLTTLQTRLQATAK